MPMKVRSIKSSEDFYIFKFDNGLDYDILKKEVTIKKDLLERIYLMREKNWWNPTVEVSFIQVWLLNS